MLFLQKIGRRKKSRAGGCRFAQWTDPAGGEPLLSFAAITDDPPPEVAAAGHDRKIVNLKPGHPSLIHIWTLPTRDLV